MDEFFQKLRKIQKKERNESGLARVGEDFYKRVHRYLEELMDTVGNDPFAKEQYLLRDTQRIATEICERREHKITDSAVMNIQRSYHLFKGKPQFDLQDTNPLNLTPEEEQLYFSLIDTLRSYRGKIIPSLDALDDENLIQKPKIEPESFSNKEKQVKEENFKKESDNLSSSKGGSLSQQPQHSEDISDYEVSDKLAQDLNQQYLNEDRIKEDESFPGVIAPENIKKTSQSKSSENAEEKSIQNIDLETIVIFEELPSIVGVDEKVYGPFYPQDVIIMPESNANIFINARKGRIVRK